MNIHETLRRKQEFQDLLEEYRNELRPWKRASYRLFASELNKALPEEIRISFQTIYHWKNGKTTPDANWLRLCSKMIEKDCWQRRFVDRALGILSPGGAIF